MKKKVNYKQPHKKDSFLPVLCIFLFLGLFGLYFLRSNNQETVNEEKKVSSEISRKGRQNKKKRKISYEKIKELENKVRQLPVSKYQENLDIYKQLLKLRPDNEKYKGKVKYYKNRLQRQKKIESQFNPWNGSHINLTKLIKSSMHDPSSYKHIRTIYWDMKNYLVIATTFSGKNLFGARTQNTTKAKVSLDGKVLKILETL